MDERERVKRLLLNGPKAVPPSPMQCTHQGFLMPMVLMPQIIQGQQPPETKPTLMAKLFNKGKLEAMNIQVWVTLTAHCVRCGQVFNFGPPVPPAAEPEKPVAPENVGVQRP